MARMVLNAQTHALGFYARFGFVPEGEEYEEALAVARALRQLAAGFYFRWVYPRGEPEPLILSWLVAVVFTPYLGVKLLPKNLGQGAHHDVYDRPVYHRLRRVVDAPHARRAWSRCRAGCAPTPTGRPWDA